MTVHRQNQVLSISRDRVRGAMLGLALGDAYGRTLEFLKDATVRQSPVTIAPGSFRWTDDTHMSLYLAEAVLDLHPHVDFDADGFGTRVGARFVEWLEDPITPTTGPGKTCLAGARAFRLSGDWRSSGIKESDGCGAVMRICPLPVVFEGTTLTDAARVSAMVTHAHPNAAASAIVGAQMLRWLLEGTPLTRYWAERGLTLAQMMCPEAPAVQHALSAALLQSDQNIGQWLDEDAIPEGDGGWRSPSALGLAVCAALRWGEHGFPVAVERAARIYGDSDSVAAICGMFLGAHCTEGGLPVGWLQALYECDRIIETADLLFERSQATVASPSPLSASPKRTSVTHPIRVDWVTTQVGNQNGQIGITFAPGKKGDSSLGERWDRDLATDLDRLIREFKVGLLVSLVEDHELDLLSIPNLVEACNQRGIVILRVPVPDGLVPSKVHAAHAVQTALAFASAGHRVVFHCRGGLGRAGTLAAAALVSVGIEPQRAIAQTRAARPGAIENHHQERFVLEWR